MKWNGANVKFGKRLKQIKKTENIGTAGPRRSRYNFIKLLFELDRTAKKKLCSKLGLPAL